MTDQLKAKIADHIRKDAAQGEETLFRSNPELITPEYREQQAQMHAKGDYGVVGHQYANMVSGLWVQLGQPRVLDYGCGQCSLSQALPQVPFDLYDPAIERYAKEPEGEYELVVCTDVLEHIEPDLLSNVVQDIASHCSKMCFMQIATGPAKKFLPDGRNAHLTQERVAWWISILDGAGFDIQTVSRTGHGFICVLTVEGAETEAQAA